MEIIPSLWIPLVFLLLFSIQPGVLKKLLQPIKPYGLQALKVFKPVFSFLQETLCGSAVLESVVLRLPFLYAMIAGK